MKTPSPKASSPLRLLAVLVSLLFLSTGSLFAKRHSHQVEVTKITSVEIKKDVIRITGDAKTTALLESDASHGNSSVYGRPAQVVVGRSFDGVFELKPTFIETPDTAPKKLRESIKMTNAVFAQNWKATVKRADQLKKGESVSLVFQGAEMLTQDYKIRRVSGSGSIVATRYADLEASAKKDPLAAIFQKEIYLSSPWSAWR